MEVTSSLPTTPTRAAAGEEAPWQFAAWLEAGVVSAAFRAQGGMELSRLQKQHTALVAYGSRRSIQPSLAHVMATTTQWMADITFERAAMALGWHMLNVVNAVNEQPGLAIEKLHISLQELSYNVLQSLGCATAWATPVYRPLPAAAAGLVPGTTSKISLQQCLQIECNTPAVCHHHYDGSWNGDCSIYLPHYQLMTVTELGKALTRDKVMQYLSNCSSSKSLSELLLLQFHKGLLEVSPQAMMQLQHEDQQQQQRQLASTAAAAKTAVMGCDASHSTSSFASGGGTGDRGYPTALGADGDDRVGRKLTLVPAGLNRQQRDRQACLGSQLVAGSTVASSSSSGSSKPRGKQGVLRRFGSALRRFCAKALRA